MAIVPMADAVFNTPASSSENNKLIDNILDLDARLGPVLSSSTAHARLSALEGVGVPTGAAGTIIGWALRTTVSSGNATTTAIGVLRLDSMTLVNGRTYSVKVNCHPNSTIDTDNCRIEVRYNTSGTATASSPVLPGAQAYVTFGTPWAMDVQYTPGANQTVSFLLCVAQGVGSLGTVSLYADGTRNTELKVVCDGPAVSDTGVDL